MISLLFVLILVLIIVGVLTRQLSVRDAVFAALATIAVWVLIGAVL